MRRPVPTSLLQNLGVDEAVIGDLVEQYQSGRSGRWFWRQVLIATFVIATKRAWLTFSAVVMGWAALWLFFGFLGVPLARLDGYLIARGFVEPYSGAWWLRGIVMWIVVGLPFLGTGWLVATVARRTPVLPVLTFALSVSTTILIALLLDMDQGATLDLRMWLTVPLFLLVAPATAIVIGGVAAVRNAAGRNGFPPRSSVPS